VPTTLTVVAIISLVKLIGLIGLIGLLTLTGCSRRPVSTGPAIPLSPEETTRILDPLERHSQAVERYQAVVRLRGKGPDGKFRATELVVFERPDRVRVELLAAFGASRWIAVTGAGEITVLFPRSREYLEETAVEDVVDALLGIRLSPEEVMAILAGSGLPLGGAEPVRAERQGDRVRIALGEGRRVDVEADQVREARRSGYRVLYPTDWKRKGRGAPDRIEISSEKIEATLTVEDLDINVRLDPEAFVLNLPQGAYRLGLAQIGGEAVFVKPSQ
jgi:hypothetical protein